jgi:purine-binding chemotaxis protein CheW
MNQEKIKATTLALAQARSDAMDSVSALDDILQFLVFQCGKGNFGVNIIETHEILKPVVITRLPNVEDEILGVINLRGNIIPVVDVNRKFSGKHTELSNDRIMEVARISSASIEGGEIRGFSNQYVKGVGRSEQRLFLILNLDALTGSQRKKEKEATPVLES